MMLLQITTKMDDEFSDEVVRSGTSSPESLDANRERSDRPRRRARGRGRGRGRGRRVERDRMPNRADTATEAREQRHTQLQERISNMSEESVREILHTVCIRQPSFILNILEESSDRSESPKNPTENKPGWCRCTYCRDMPTDKEKVCCNQMPQNCHSRLPDFQTVVLDELVLEIAMRYRDDILAQPHDDNYNRFHRHTAYRQYILWIHGYLGAGNRRVIPSCCVWKIRDKYPDPFGQYIGFIGGRLG